MSPDTAGECQDMDLILMIFPLRGFLLYLFVGRMLGCDDSMFLKHHKLADSEGHIGEKLEIVKEELIQLKLTWMNLSCSEIEESNMNNSFLTNNDMSDCYFFSISFEETNLSECILSKIVFDYASLKHSNIRICVGIKASFDGTDLSFVNISGSDLRRASFRRVNLSYAKFSNVDLTNALIHERRKTKNGA